MNLLNFHSSQCFITTRSFYYKIPVTSVFFSAAGLIGLSLSLLLLLLLLKELHGCTDYFLLLLLQKFAERSFHLLTSAFPSCCRNILPLLCWWCIHAGLISLHKTKALVSVVMTRSQQETRLSGFSMPPFVVDVVQDDGFLLPITDDYDARKLCPFSPAVRWSCQVNFIYSASQNKDKMMHHT